MAIQGDSLASVGDIEAGGRVEVDATGLAVAPGFINMLSHATESLIADGRSQSDIRQGVTLEVFGEGSSLGPLTQEMKATRRERQNEITYDIDWTTLDEGLQWLAGRGIACNVASFVRRHKPSHSRNWLYEPSAEPGRAGPHAWLVDLPDIDAHPAVIVSRTADNARRHKAIIAVVTGRQPRRSTEIGLDQRNGLAKPSIVQTDELFTVKFGQLAEQWGSLDAEQLEQVSAALRQVEDMDLG